MCGPEDPFSYLTCSLQESHFKQKSLKISSQDPLWEKIGNFSLYSSIFAQILALKPPNWKISVHKTRLSEAKISSQAPHFRNPGHTPLIKKKLEKLSAPPPPECNITLKHIFLVHADLKTQLPQFQSTSIAPFWNQYNSKNQNNMSTHLTIKNENCPNPRTGTPKKKGLSLVIVAGDMIFFVVIECEADFHSFCHWLFKGGCAHCNMYIFHF